MADKCRPRPVVLMILDGFGERAETDANAVRLAKTPSLDALYARYPHGLIGASGPDVGLAPGQMGNSEVGHLNLGAGRIATMDITRIDNAIHDHCLQTNAVIRATLDATKNAGGRLHLMGLVSDGGVHSHIRHLFALIDAAHELAVPVVVHAFLDGRDVMPGTGGRFLDALQTYLDASRKGAIGTVAGRYWAMDRDTRWDRVERSYRAIVSADGPRFATGVAGAEMCIAAGTTDEFVEPFVVGAYDGVDSTRDSGLHFNFRGDRARELVHALVDEQFTGFARGARPPFRVFACMTSYDATLGLPIAFPKETYRNILPEVLANAGLMQFRCAETEKYAHVTYFFNGGREDAFENEQRQLVPSPRDVTTYDHKPEMAAKAVGDAVVMAIESNKFDFIVVNFANPDMVGHTGVLSAAVLAVEEVDVGIGRIADATLVKRGALFITADHGNCEIMIDPTTGAPHTTHTLNPVPLLYVNEADRNCKIRSGGRICDVAPTILELMDIPVPDVMTGFSLIER